MKFLVDAQLPKALARWLQQRGHDVVHTLDLPEGNRTKDSSLLTLSNASGRTLITKDADFQIAFEQLFEKNESIVLAEINQGRFVELNRGAVIVHS